MGPRARHPLPNTVLLVIDDSMTSLRSVWGENDGMEGWLERDVDVPLDQRIEVVGRFVVIINDGVFVIIRFISLSINKAFPFRDIVLFQTNWVRFLHRPRDDVTQTS